MRRCDVTVIHKCDLIGRIPLGGQSSVPGLWRGGGCSGLPGRFHMHMQTGYCAFMHRHLGINQTPDLRWRSGQVSAFSEDARGDDLKKEEKTPHASQASASNASPALGCVACFGLRRGVSREPPSLSLSTVMTFGNYAFVRKGKRSR